MKMPTLHQEQQNKKGYKKEKMNKELERLKTTTSLDCFFCGFILSDNEEELNIAINGLGNQVTQITDCDSVEKIKTVKDRVMKGEKLILSNLSPLYKIFAAGDKENHDGIYQFYQKFTEAYRDRLWTTTGQIYFVLSKEEEEQFYHPGTMRDNHFRTMLMKTFDLTKQKTYRKEM